MYTKQTTPQQTICSIFLEICGKFGNINTSNGHFSLLLQKMRANFLQYPFETLSFRYGPEKASVAAAGYFY